MREGAIYRLSTMVGAWWSRHAQPSDAFEAFRHEFFADPDGFDLDNLRALEGRERLQAERVLLAALPDPCAILGLSALATARAKRKLQALFERERAHGGDLMIAAASACWAMAPHPRYALAVAERLKMAPASSERRDAAAALAGMPTPEIEDALDGALDDIDPLVRHHAARALLTLYGAPIDATGLRTLAQRIVGRDARPGRAPQPYRESSGAVM